MVVTFSNDFLDEAVKGGFRDKISSIPTILYDLGHSASARRISRWPLNPILVPSCFLPPQISCCRPPASTPFATQDALFCSALGSHCKSFFFDIIGAMDGKKLLENKRALEE